MMQTVYNWQFVQGLYLWAKLLGNMSKMKEGDSSPHENTWYKEIGFPLIEIITILKKFVFNLIPF